jgi:transcriptional regulator with XRE-family HTH domain
MLTILVSIARSQGAVHGQQNAVRVSSQSGIDEMEGQDEIEDQTDTPFVEELPRLLRERGMSLRALAATMAISDSHLSRVIRRVDYKTPSPDLTRRAALALDLPPDYFPEFREAYVIERLKSDPRLRNDLYVRLNPERRARSTTVKTTVASGSPADS